MTNWPRPKRRRRPFPRPWEPPKAQVADTAVCIRGGHLTLGRKVPRGVPAVMASAELKFVERPEWPPRTGRMAGRSPPSADGPRFRQSRLALALRPRAGGIHGQSRPARRSSVTPGTARLAGRRVHGPRLVGEGAAPSAPPVGDLPASQPPRPGRHADGIAGADRRSRQSSSLALPATAARSGSYSRCAAGRQRTTRYAHGRFLAACGEPSVLVRPHLEGHDPV